MTKPQLTERQITIIKLIAEGLSKKEIGERLFTSERNIKRLVIEMLIYTGCKNSAALVHWAHENKVDGFISQ